MTGGQSTGNGGTATSGAGTGGTSAGTGTSTGSGTGGTTSGGGTKSGSTSAGGSPATCTSEKSTITIGSVGAQSGFAGAALAGGIDAIRAGVAAANAQGGINCHPIKYFVADDGGDPSENQSETAQMVEQNHIIAEVFSDDPFGSQSSVNYMTQHKIPIIGSEGGDQWYHETPFAFPVAADGVDLYRSNFGMLSTSLTSSQKQHVAVEACIEAAICSQFGSSGATQYAKTIGLKIVHVAAVSLTQPDYTSACQAARSAGATALFVVGDGSMLSRTEQSCAGINYHPQFASSPVASAATIVDDPNVQGVYMGATTLPWVVSSNAEAAEYVNDLTKYVPGGQPTGSGAAGWASWLVFRYALEKVTAANPTSVDLYNALNTIKNNDFGGFTAPLTYAAGKDHLGPNCWWTMQIKNKKWYALNGGKRNCAAA